MQPLHVALLAAEVSRARQGGGGGRALGLRRRATRLQGQLPQDLQHADQHGECG